MNPTADEEAVAIKDAYLDRIKDLFHAACSSSNVHGFQGYDDFNKGVQAARLAYRHAIHVLGPIFPWPMQE